MKLKMFTTTSASTAVSLAMLLTPPTKCSVLLCAALSSQSSDLAGKGGCAALTSSMVIGQRYFRLNLKFPCHLPFLQRKVSDLEVFSSHRSCCNVPPQRRQKQVLCSSSCQWSAKPIQGLTQARRRNTPVPACLPAR